MKSVLNLIFIVVCYQILGQTNLFNDVGIFTGLNFNRSARVEIFQTVEYDYESHFLHGHNQNRQKHFFLEVNSTIWNHDLRKRLDNKFWQVNFRSGIYYTQTQRNMNISYYLVDKPDTSLVLINDLDNLFYVSKANNIGLSAAFIFTKKWASNYAFEYGLIYRIDYAFLKKFDYKRVPEDGRWKKTDISNWEKIHANINQDILLTLSPRFDFSSQLSVGLQIDITTILFQNWYVRNREIILGEYNNQLNSNLFYGLSMKYRLK